MSRPVPFFTSRLKRWSFAIALTSLAFGVLAGLGGQLSSFAAGLAVSFAFALAVIQVLGRRTALQLDRVLEHTRQTVAVQDSSWCEDSEGMSGCAYLEETIPALGSELERLQARLVEVQADHELECSRLGEERSVLREDHAAALGKAEAESKARTGLLAKLSHGIRTPMNGILGMAELVLDTGLDAEQREYVEIARDSAQELLQVLDEVAAFSRVEAGRTEARPEPFALRELSAEVLQSLASRAHGKGLELTAAIPPSLPDALVGDHGLLEQVLRALVAHGIRRARQGEVVLAVEQAEGTGDELSLRFSVRDTGPPLDAQEVEGMFELLGGNEQFTSGFDGAGLGMAIASRFVDVLGGTLSASQGQSSGGLLEFVIPFRRSEANALVGTGVALVGVRVLVLDDKDSSRETLHEQLVAWGADVSASDDADAALALVDGAAQQGRAFDVVLVERELKEHGCFWLASQLANKPVPGPSLVALLNSSDRGDTIERWGAAGGQAFVRKPVRTSALLAAMRQASPIDTPAIPGGRSSVSGASKPARQRWRVLVAEDNPINQAVILRVLDRAGHSTVLAENGQEAVDLTKEEEFDIVLMDLQMPVMDGLEATRLIRARPGGSHRKHLPIVAVTAHVLKSERERCSEAGMDAHVGKPIDSAALLQIMAGLLEEPSRPALDASSQPELVGAAPTPRRPS